MERYGANDQYARPARAGRGAFWPQRDSPAFAAARKSAQGYWAVTFSVPTMSGWILQW